MNERFKVAVLTLFLALALSLGGGTAKAITWGEDDVDELFPNVGTIMVQFSGSPDYFQLCSGTLIHPLVFLTAGHCVAGLDFYRDLGLLTDVKVSFALDPSVTSTYLDVDAEILHPDYWTAPPSRRHWPDVGALTLTQPVVGIPLAVVADEGFLAELKSSHLLKPRTKILTVGYGSLLEWPPPTVTYPSPMRRYAFSEYRALLKSWLLVSQNPALGNGGTGYGDSGGPAFWVDPDDGSLTLVGTTSTGDPNLVATTFFHRADIPRTLDFIESVIGSVAADGAGISGIGGTPDTIMQVGPLDLDIKQFKVSKNVRIGRAIKIELMVKNTGDLDDEAEAMVIGDQNGQRVYSEIMMVSDAVGGGHTKWSFPSFTPNATWDINWTATITDDDPDIDTATATTSVR
jgi:hypothetical protein